MEITGRSDGPAAHKKSRENDEDRRKTEPVLDAALVSELPILFAEPIDSYQSLSFKDNIQNEDFFSWETDMHLQDKAQPKLVFVVTQIHHPLPYIEVAPQAIEVLLRRNLSLCPLKKFTYKGKAMKHEYFVIKLIRRFVKSLELALYDRPETVSGLMAVLVKNTSASESLLVFRKFVSSNRAFLQDYVKAEYLPETDRKTKRKRPASYSSFNKKFVQSYLKLSPYLRIAYYHFCEVIFQAEASVLRGAWGMNCCTLDSHTDDCPDLWRSLKTYTQVQMLEELNITAFTPY